MFVEVKLLIVILQSIFYQNWFRHHFIDIIGRSKNKLYLYCKVHIFLCLYCLSLFLAIGSSSNNTVIHTE